MSEGIGDDCPRPGRPRSEAVSEAILAAALDLVAEHGSTGAVTMEAVAARSGASKATVYRRWSSKEELIAAAVDSIKSPPVLEFAHESVRDDLVRLGKSIRGGLSERERRILRCVLLESEGNPALREHQDRMMARRRQVATDLFRYWIDRGELRDDLDPALAATMFTGPLLMILVYGHYPELRSPDLVERVADQLLSGLRR